MKTDSIFYRLFQEFPDIFFELIGNPPQTAEGYKFSSIEIKQTAFRIDGVFLPTQGEEAPIYFVEVQFQTDTEIYSRLISEISLYLRQNQPKNSWRGVVIYPNRSLDTADIKNYSEFFASQRITRIYLNELGETASLPVGIATMKLVVDDEDTAIIAARELIDRTQQEINIEPQRRQLLELIETILVYKFPTMSREEIEGMFGLSDLKQTRVYQEGKQEGKQEGAREEKFRMISLLLRLGLSFEQTAKELGLSLEEVQQEIQKQPPSQDA
ncbi:Rpn family recombination-promoting nuclease/putative transposase [Desmonostoc muscorum LEGE 12446]|uniref:Rpn family recombination-promoting nuclease/putative transposase n=1 Tax=Desmonostoc muscorum LEGE 12446 TaxID=1828758 RepID=A0A8J6ZNX8_DESMC|nr:Rpn family recombination-promoting nuclease/putative transposase [Desmonostoc muscorum]MCF2145397.1 Rpn family recombination-promoting nuclease/putative transposase [Desmonostoc muscorum LEGE 12446]